jgi:hypothetical protein
LAPLKLRVNSAPRVVTFQIAFVHARFDAAIILWSVAGS